ncbi:LytTR family DNA-binding domain-containing protein [Sphingomonas sp. SUN039]|uniref:LytTR family DNA-binding domain-containing protein n=1 Tax=Sphingomonas sp. SUN039 TaxID=2937787 RepID=UPI0021645748|nr:LytTR family transcriptional regulator DNA-binding domain-containing protein [Sphingomonas sp. SUN039]UVO54461.1 LytTR family transcriptional regulator DNA-binding domain-containing protein [Sphingomonas sp. SUN039]
MTQAATLDRAPSRPLVSALYWIGGAILVGAVLAALGPFGTYLNDGAGRRLGYWVASTLLGVMLYGTAFRIAKSRVPAGSIAWWPVLSGAALLASIPQTLFTRAAAFWLWPELARLSLPFWLWFAQTATIGLLAMLGAALWLRRTGASSSKTSPVPVHDAVSPALETNVLALQMEDHYVRVHRPGGSELLLMPLSQAIGATRTSGLQIHRSWWIAEEAVVAVEGTPRSMRVRLSNGVVAPVARSAVIRLRAAGWIGNSEGR